MQEFPSNCTVKMQHQEKIAKQPYWSYNKVCEVKIVDTYIIVKITTCALLALSHPLLIQRTRIRKTGKFKNSFIGLLAVIRPLNILSLMQPNGVIFLMILIPYCRWWLIFERFIKECMRNPTERKIELVIIYID